MSVYVRRKYHHNLKIVDLKKVLLYSKALYIVTRNFNITCCQ